MNLWNNFLRWLRRLLRMKGQITLPPIAVPPWNVNGGAEAEAILPGWKHLENDILKAYYMIHCQIWPDDWTSGEFPLKAGDEFEFITVLEVLFEPATTKTADIYMQGKDTPFHKPVKLSQGINTISTKGVWVGVGAGSYVLTVASEDPTNNSQIHFKIKSVTLNY